MIDDYDNADNDDDNDWQWRSWRWNVVMEPACKSLVLIINRKDFGQAYTVGLYKTSVIVVQYFSHQQKFLCGFKYLKILMSTGKIQAYIM